MTRAISILLLSLLAQPLAAQDVEKGKVLFKKCKSCHMISPDAKNSTGPNLNGVVGRPAGSVAGYKYSKSMLAAGETGLIWDEDSLFNYLAGPTKFLRAHLQNRKAKAKMSLRLKKADERRDVIAYLATFSLTDTTTYKDKVCVVNLSKHTFFFAAEAENGPRELGYLAPGETLCSVAKTSGTGVVSVYEDPDQLEGCSRLVTAGDTEELIKYADFDRCAWSSNS